MTVKRIARAAGLTAAVFTAFGAAAAPVQAAPPVTGTTWNVSQASVSSTVSPDDVWIQECRFVTAQDLTVFRSSDGRDAFWILGFGTTVNTIGGPVNNRYKIESPAPNISQTAWISADPRWTAPCPR